MLKFLRKLGGFGIRREKENNKIVFPEAYYKKNRDIKENLLMFEEALHKIKAKYEPNSFEQAFQNQFGEEFSYVDFLYKDRVLGYSERNGISEEQMNNLQESLMPIMEKRNKRMGEEIELAECCVYIRNGQVSNRIFSRAAELEEIYGNAEKAKDFKNKALEIKKSKKISNINEDAKSNVISGTMRTIRANINPFSRSPEYLENWKKAIDYVEKELSKCGLDLKDYGNDEEISKAWAKICHLTQNEKIEQVYKVAFERKEVMSKESPTFKEYEVER